MKIRSVTAIISIIVTFFMVVTAFNPAWAKKGGNGGGGKGNGGGDDGGGSTVVCTGTESPVPTIAFISSSVDDGTLITSDLYLSSDSGCDQYLLVEDVEQVLPRDFDDNPTRCLNCVTWLRIAMQGNTGFVTWVNENRNYWGQDGVWFEFDPGTEQVSLLSAAPETMYLPQLGDMIWGSDVQFTVGGESGAELELAMLERTTGAIDRWLVVFNPETGERQHAVTFGCPVTDADGACYEATWPVFWGSTTDEIFFSIFEYDTDSATQGDRRGIARVSRNGDTWGSPQVLMLNDASLKVESVSANGELVYDYEEYSYTRGGKLRGIRRSFGLVLAADCRGQACSPSDGVDLGIERDGKGSLFITPDGRGLVFDSLGRGQDGVVQEFTDPILGSPGRELIMNVNGEFATVQ